MTQRRTQRRTAKAYYEAVDWIAYEDGPADDLTAEELESAITVALVADLYRRELSEVARDVMRVRKCDAFKKWIQG